MPGLNHLALVIESISEDKLKGFLAIAHSEGTKVLSLYSNSSFEESILNKVSQGIRIHCLPLNNARARLLEKFKELVLKSDSEDITEEELVSLIAEDKEFPEPDLIISASKDSSSLENSVIHEANYAEIYFAKKNADEFQDADLKEAVKDFHSRKRNFGQ